MSSGKGGEAGNRWSRLTIEEQTQLISDFKMNHGDDTGKQMKYLQIQFEIYDYSYTVWTVRESLLNKKVGDIRTVMCQ